MDSKEIIRRVIEFDNPPRIGLDFNRPHQKDIASIGGTRAVSDKFIKYSRWGNYEEILNKVPGFKPLYARMADEIHKNGMKFLVHSCGYVTEIINDFIEVGVDVLQFDQPELLNVEKLAANYGGRVTFWSPVDIQAVMPTGNKELIQSEAQKMVECLGKFNGGFIAKDYPAWNDIDIKDEWAQWARDIFISRGCY